jgi:hypothetical protein
MVKRGHLANDFEPVYVDVIIYRRIIRNILTLSLMTMANISLMTKGGCWNVYV